MSEVLIPFYCRAEGSVAVAEAVEVLSPELID